MTNPLRTEFTGLCVAVAATLMLLAMMPGRNAWAQQDWPGKAVKVVVPFPPGGTADLLGRVVAQHLADALKQPLARENSNVSQAEF